MMRSFALDLALEAVRRLGDLLLEEAVADALEHAAQLADLLDVGDRLALGLVGQRLDEVTSRPADQPCW